MKKNWFWIACVLVCIVSLFQWQRKDQNPNRPAEVLPQEECIQISYITSDDAPNYTQLYIDGEDCIEQVSYRSHLSDASSLDPVREIERVYQPIKQGKVVFYLMEVQRGREPEMPEVRRDYNERVCYEIDENLALVK